MKKKTYKMGLVGCMSVLVMLTGLWVYDQNKIPVSEEPVVSIKNDEPKQEETKEKINYPYLDENVKVVRTYYDQNDDKETWFNKVKMLTEKLGYAANMKDYRKNPENYKGSVADISTVIRVMVTSCSMTPDLYEILKLLGPERIKKRLFKF